MHIVFIREDAAPRVHSIVMKINHLAFPLLVLLGASPVFAKDLQVEQSNAIKLIKETANELCVDAQISGSGHQAGIKGEVDAKLVALVKKLGEANGSLAADYSQDAFVGVLREQVLESIKAANTCKMHVFDVLTEKLLPSGSAHTEPVIEKQRGSRLSPQDAYLIATHPTRVVVKELKFMSFLDDGDTNFLSAVLANESEIPAQNVVVDWISEKKGVPLTSAKVVPFKKSNYAKALGSTGIAISPKSDSYFPLVSVAELNAFFLAKNSNYCLYDASPEPIDPAASHEALAREMDKAKVYGETLAWHSSTQQIFVRLRIKYKTIFEQTVTSYAMVFVHLVEKGAEGPLWYPSTQSVAPARCISV